MTNPVKLVPIVMSVLFAFVATLLTHARVLLVLSSLRSDAGGGGAAAQGVAAGGRRRLRLL